MVVLGQAFNIVGANGLCLYADPTADAIVVKTPAHSTDPAFLWQLVPAYNQAMIGVAIQSQLRQSFLYSGSQQQVQLISPNYFDNRGVWAIGRNATADPNNVWQQIFMNSYREYALWIAGTTWSDGAAVVTSRGPAPWDPFPANSLWRFVCPFTS